MNKQEIQHRIMNAVNHALVAKNVKVTTWIGDTGLLIIVGQNGTGIGMRLSEEETVLSEHSATENEYETAIDIVDRLRGTDLQWSAVSAMLALEEKRGTYSVSGVRVSLSRAMRIAARTGEEIRKITKFDSLAPAALWV